MDQYISLILNFLLGGGFLTTMLMLRTQKRQAVANVRTSEIDNLDRVAKIWRESLEAREKYFEEQMASLRTKMNDMEGTIRTLSTTNKQILRILKEINHDNLEQKKEEAANVAGQR